MSVEVVTVRHRVVNSFIVLGNGVSLVDCGVKGGEQAILEALADLGKGPRDVKRIIVTHHHADHAGALARVKALTRAPVYMHKEDADLVRRGIPTRPAFTARGFLGRLLPVARAFMPRSYPACEVEHEVQDGDLIEDGFRVHFTPGHSAGHIALLRDGFLFAGDAAMNVRRRPGPPFLFEDDALARQSFQQLAELDFEAAGFGHGQTIEKGASAKFKKR